jgi:hypothetical protein
MAPEAVVKRIYTVSKESAHSHEWADAVQTCLQRLTDEYLLLDVAGKQSQRSLSLKNGASDFLNGLLQMTKSFHAHPSPTLDDTICPFLKSLHTERWLLSILCCLSVSGQVQSPCLQSAFVDGLSPNSTVVTHQSDWRFLPLTVTPVGQDGDRPYADRRNNTPEKGI